MLRQRSDAAFLTIGVYRTSQRSARDVSDAVLVSDMNSRVGADRTVRIWDVSGNAQLITLRSQRRPIQRIAFSPDGATLASTSLDGTVQLWDAQAGHRLRN